MSQSRASACAKSFLTEYFSSKQLIVWVVLVVIGVGLRWIGLELKPYHLDEAQHAMFGKYFFDFPGPSFASPPEGHFYRYDPVIHGPFMYNAYRFLYWVLPCGPWTARVPVALIGSFLIFVPLIFRRFFARPVTVLSLTAAIAVSPTLIYWSRFLRHDPFVWIAMLMMIYAVTLASGVARAVWFMLGVALHLCTMENYFVHGAIVIGYLVFEVLVLKLRGQESAPSLVGALYSYLRTNKRSCLIALLIAAFFYIYFYTSGFRYLEGLPGPLKAFEYWLGQHKQQRIDGPFLYHFYTLSWYELPFILAFFLSIILVGLRAKTLERRALMAIFLVVMMANVAHWELPVSEVKIWAFLKLKDSFDVAWFLFIVPYSILLTLHHLVRGERVLAFWGYFFTSMFFSYSYLGEKVPWLASYAMIPGMVYLAMFFERYFIERPIKSWQELRIGRLLEAVGGGLLVLATIFCLEQGGFAGNRDFLVAGSILFLLGFADKSWSWFGRVNLLHLTLAVLIIYNGRAAIQTNFAYAGDAREFISQVHTSKELHGMMALLRRQIYGTPEAVAPSTLTNGETGWPLAWYMSELPRHQSDLKEYDPLAFNYIFDNFNEPGPHIPDNYRYERLAQRGWWWPEYKDMTLKKFLNYSLNHTPWNEPGYFYGSILARPAVVRE